MKQKLKLPIILCVVVVVCSTVCHAMISWLHIRVIPSVYQCYGSEGLKPHIVLHGSSLAYDGIDWGRISEEQGEAIESWASAGSSPPEWEMLHSRSPNVTGTYIVVSPFDLNEYYLCDFRADIVPISQTIRDLWQSGADWKFSKRILSQYPMMIIREFFPTVGRSDGVMTGVRANLLKVIYMRSNAVVSDEPKFESTEDSDFKQKVTDWSPARLDRRLVLMRTRCEGKHSFSGPKAMALAHLLRQSEKQGWVVLIVVPVSPIYHEEFLPRDIMQKFEMAILAAQHSCPQAKLIRLDQIPALQDNNMFLDAVHLNMYGQKIATEALASNLKTLGISR